MESFLIKGFVGAIPEAKRVKGVDVVEFIVAVNGGLVDRPKKLWVKCVAWRELGKAVNEKIFQGDLVGMNGRILDVEAWIDQKDKKPKGRLVFLASSISKSVAPGKFEDIKNQNYERLEELARMVTEELPF